MSVLYFSKTFSANLNIVYLFSPVKGHSYAALKGRHLPAPIPVKAPKKGARVFSVDYGYATYLGKDKEGKAKILTDDGHKKTTYIGLIVEEY